MENNKDVPIWLQLKKQYIDDNFDELLNYFKGKRSAGAPRDDFYEISVRLVAERVGDLLSEIAGKPLYEDDSSPDILKFNIRLLGLSLLINASEERSKEIYLAMIAQFMLLLPKRGEEFAELFFRGLKSESIVSFGFTFSELVNFLPEVFAYHLVSQSRFGEALRKPMVYEGMGRGRLTGEGFDVCATGLTSAEEMRSKLARNLDTGLGGWLSTTQNEKMKSGVGNTLDSIENFGNEFRKLQERPLKMSAERRLLRYSAGDQATVRVTGLPGDEAGTVFVVTDNPNYTPVRGRLVFSKPVLAYYYTNMFWKNFNVGDRLKVKVVNPDEGTFSIEESFVNFIIEDCRSYWGVGGICPAKLTQIKPHGYYWLNSRGVCVWTPAVGGYSRGEVVDLKIVNFGSGIYYGRVEGEIVDSDDVLDDFNEREVRYDCIRAFCASTPDLEDSQHDGDSFAPLDPMVAGLIMRLYYYYQRTLPRPSERFLFLVNAMAIARLIGEEASESYLNFIGTYLRALVRFVNDEPLEGVELSPDLLYADSLPVRIRLAIVDVLKEYGKGDYSELLERYALDKSGEMSQISDLARLVQASNSLGSTLTGSSRNLLKREIIRSLSLEVDEDVELEAESTPYIGMEGQTVEFKTSMVYPPDNNMQAAPHEQMQNIAKGVCAFLNSSVGGTLYIGVNDTGHVQGLAEDFKYLRCFSFDTYSRILQDNLTRLFGLEVMSYIHIDAAYGGNVAVVRVEPHPFRVVELGDTAYLRVERESRRMSDKVKREMSAKKLTTDRNLVNTVLNLQHAEFKQKRVELHGLITDSGRNVTVRVVEPFLVMPEHGLVQCYDCERHENTVFHFSRIGYVKVLEDKWQYRASHHPLEVDDFHSCGELSQTVSLQMDTLAKNRLQQLYPETKSHLVPNRDEDIWYYDAKVCSLEEVGRFCLAFADHVKVQSTPRLAEWLRKFREKYLLLN